MSALSSTSSSSGAGAEIKTVPPLVGSAPNIETTDWDAKEVEALNFITSFNGLDFYSSEVVALGSVPKDQYLVLPRGLRIPNTPAQYVGSKEGNVNLSTADQAAIYALNKAIAPDNVDAVKFAISRVEAVRAGWVSDQKEIRYEDASPDSGAVFRADLPAIAACMTTAVSYAFFHPLAAEFVFRTTGHHFLSGSGQVEEYRAKYHKLYTAALLNDLVNFMSNSNQFHTCLHWVSPARVWDVIRANINTPTIPDCIKLRVTAAPAGTALITTTMAVMDLARSTGVHDAIRQHMNVDIKDLSSMANDIKANPVKYHKTFTAYKFPEISEAEAKRISAMLDIARLVAPITQAIVEVYGRETELARAKVLKKYATSNPLLTRRLRTYLRDQASKESMNLAEVFTFAGSGREE